jgi:hypothetical protein
MSFSIAGSFASLMTSHITLLPELSNLRISIKLLDGE